MRNPWKFKSWSSACRMPFSLTTIKTLIFNSSLVTCLSMLFFEFILFKLHSAWFCTFLPFTQFGFGYYFFTFFFFFGLNFCPLLQGLLFTCQTSLYCPPVFPPEFQFSLFFDLLCPLIFKLGNFYWSVFSLAFVFSILL